MNGLPGPSDVGVHSLESSNGSRVLLEILEALEHVEGTDDGAYAT